MTQEQGRNQNDKTVVLGIVEEDEDSKPTTETAQPESPQLEFSFDN